jgi:hypothetical protein
MDAAAPAKGTCPRRLHCQPSRAKGQPLEAELCSAPGEALKADGHLSEDEDAAMTRTIAGLVLNLRGIDPEIRQSGLDLLCTLAVRR